MVFIYGCLCIIPLNTRLENPSTGWTSSVAVFVSGLFWKLSHTPFILDLSDLGPSLWCLAVSSIFPRLGSTPPPLLPVVVVVVVVCRFFVTFKQVLANHSTHHTQKRYLLWRAGREGAYVSHCRQGHIIYTRHKKTKRDYSDCQTMMSPRLSCACMLYLLTTTSDIALILVH